MIMVRKVKMILTPATCHCEIKSFRLGMAVYLRDYRDRSTVQ